MRRFEFLCFALLFSSSCIIVVPQETGAAARPKRVIAVPVTPSPVTFRQPLTEARAESALLAKLVAKLRAAPPNERGAIRKEIHASVDRLKEHVARIRKSTSQLPDRRLERSREWADSRGPIRDEFLALSRDLSAAHASLKQTGSDDDFREDVKSRRSEVESGFKDAEQHRNDDYNTLQEIVKTVNEQQGIFNKSMM